MNEINDLKQEFELEVNKDTALNNLLKDIINRKSDVNDETKKSDLDEFVNIYDGKFRHSYSEIAQQTCVYCFYQTNESSLDDLERLATYLQQNILPMCVDKANVKNGLKKLIDHIRLEYCRLLLVKRETQDVTNAKNEAKNATEAANGATKAANRATNEAENFKKDLVAILGILAAILIGSVGSMIYGSKVFDHIEKATESQFLFGIGIVGLFFILMCCMLFSFLREITQRRDESGKICVKLKRWVVNLGNAVVCVFFFTLCIFAFFGIKSCFFNENKNTPVNKTTNNPTNITINASITENLKGDLKKNH